MLRFTAREQGQKAFTERAARTALNRDIFRAVQRPPELQQSATAQAEDPHSRSLQPETPHNSEPSNP